VQHIPGQSEGPEKVFMRTLPSITQGGVGETTLTNTLTNTGKTK
jgi:hypothetical protein